MKNNNNKISSQAVLIIIILFTTYGLFSNYLIPYILAGVTLAIIVSQLWRPYVPPILIFLFLYQFVQIFGALLYAEYMGLPFEEIAFNKDSDFLITITLCQLSLMTVMLARVQKLNFEPTLEMLTEATKKLNIKKILIVYVVSTLIFPTLISATYSNSSLNQLIQAFAVIKKVALIMLVFMYFLRKSKYNNTIILILIFEFVLSFVSFFSSFKDVFFIVTLVYLTVHPRLKSKLVYNALPMVLFLFFIMIFWSSIKDSYRAYLNQGTRTQQVSVGAADALGFIGDKIQEYNVDSFTAGSQILLHRVQYMEQYSAVYSRVPSIIEHTNGSNLFTTMQFLLMPRYLNSEKKLLDPSTKTSLYTGKSFANAEMGTSISMGYFCDLYIDYGLWVMIIPLLAIAYFLGKASNYIVNTKKYNIIMVYSLYIGVFLSIGTFESDIIYYIGSIRNYIAFMIVGNTLLLPWLNKYMSTE